MTHLSQYVPRYKLVEAQGFIADLEAQLAKTKLELSERTTEADNWKQAAYRHQGNAGFNNKKIAESLERESSANARIAEFEKMSFDLFMETDLSDNDVEKFGWKIDRENLRLIKDTPNAK